MTCFAHATCIIFLNISFDVVTQNWLNSPTNVIKCMAAWTGCSFNFSLCTTYMNIFIKYFTFSPSVLVPALGVDLPSVLASLLLRVRRFWCHQAQTSPLKSKWTTLRWVSFAQTETCSRWTWLGYTKMWLDMYYSQNNYTVKSSSQKYQVFLQFTSTISIYHLVPASRVFCTLPL